MKVNTSDLTGAALDWAVAVVDERREPRIEYAYMDKKPFISVYIQCDLSGDTEYRGPYDPHKNWAIAGPIIEREWLDVTPWPNESAEDLRWQCSQHDNIDCTYFGPTPLIAAMRCFVAAEFGSEIDIPEELI